MKTPIIVMAAAMLLAPAVDAADKQSLHDQMAAVLANAQAAKEAGNAALAQSLLDTYATLASQLPPAITHVGQPSPPVAPAAPPGGTATTNNYATGAVTAITDLATVTSTIAVATGDTYLHDVDVNVNITHTWNADLEISIKSPAGTVVVLSDNRGGSNDNVFNGTTWDDSAGLPTSDAVYANNVVATPLVAERALSAMRGENPNGNWELSVTDLAGGDVGAINGWSLDITTLDKTPIDAKTLHSSQNVVAIADNIAVFDQINVNGIGNYLCDVNAQTNITHTWNSDLQIFLQSPAGTFCTLTTQNGGSNDNVYNGTVWDDSAATPAQAAVYANLVTATPLCPEGALGTFIGENPNGQWEITIFDGAGGDVGASNGWSLNITTCIVENPECFIVIGNAPGSGSFQYDPWWGHEFTTQVDDVNEWHPVLLEDLYEMVLPTPKRNAQQWTAPSTPGGLNLGQGQIGPMQQVPQATEFTVEVLMWNPQVFPGLPEQHSNGLAVKIFPNGRVVTVPYGTSVGGMEVWTEIGFNSQGQKVLRFPFSIPLL